MLRPAAALGLLLAANPAFAYNNHRYTGKTGIGVGGGATGAGLSLKHFLTDEMAVQGVIGSWGEWGNGGLGLTADYLYEMPVLLDTQLGDLAWNVGPGLGLGVYAPTNSVALTATGVVGLELAFGPIPLDLVVEYRPTLVFVPEVYFDPIDFTGHLRVFF